MLGCKLKCAIIALIKSSSLGRTCICDVWCSLLVKPFFPCWLTMSFELPNGTTLTDLQLQKQLVSLQGTSPVSHDCVKISQRLFVLYRNFWSVQYHHAQSMAAHGFGWRVDELSSFPSLVPPESVGLYHRVQEGIKAASQRKQGFWGFAFMGGKIIPRQVIFLIASVLHRWNWSDCNKVKWNLFIARLYLYPSTHRSQLCGLLTLCTIETSHLPNFCLVVNWLSFWW